MVRNMVTMSDVAREADVSRATASYALRGDSRITKKTRSKVIAAAKKLNYSANLSARSLRSGRNGVVGVAIFELDKSYPSQMSAAISKEINAHGMQAIIQQTTNSREDEVSILQRVTSQLCDGTIFSPGNVSNEEMKALIHGKPIVLLDDHSAHPIFDSVETAGREGARTAITHLLAQGCRHIGVVGADISVLGKPSMKNSVAARRLIGCQEAFEASGRMLSPDAFIGLSPWDENASRSLAHNLADQGDFPFDGVFCLTDSIALGMIRGLYDCGISVPRDVAVIGFDGINEGASYIPSLTTISTDREDLACKAVSILLHDLNHPDRQSKPRRETAKFNLEVRESTMLGR